MAGRELEMFDRPPDPAVINEKRSFASLDMFTAGLVVVIP
jgi:hypothetical protein